MLGGAGTGTPLSPQSLQMFWLQLYTSPGLLQARPLLSGPPPSLRLLGLLGSLLAELHEGLSFFVPFPGLQQLQDPICQRTGQ